MLVQFVAQLVINPGYRGDLLKVDLSANLHPRPHLGSGFESAVGDLRRNASMDVDTEIGIRQLCINFVVHLHTELKERLPENIQTLRSVNLISPANCLRQVKPAIDELARLMCLDDSEIQKAEVQWKKLALVEWERTSKTVPFWAEVLQYRNASGTVVFEDIARLALRLLVLPWSNAEIERAFSQVSIVKSKHRNRMGNEMLNGILTIRAGLRRIGKCCHNYEYPTSVLRDIGTMAVFNTNTPAGVAAGPLSSGMEGVDSVQEPFYPFDLFLTGANHLEDPDDPAALAD